MKWVFTALAALIVGLIVLAVRSENEFQRYAAAHHCRVTGQDPGYWITTMIPVSCGNNCTMVYPMTTWYDGAKHYECDAGERFKR